MASPSDLVVVTGAGGPQCAKLVPLLYGKYPLRLVTFSGSTASRLSSQWPEAEVIRADLTSPTECARTVRDAVVIYQVGPFLHMHEATIGRNLIDACEAEKDRKGGRFQHFVSSSLLNTCLRKMSNHDNKRYVDEYLVESSLNYTILRPTDFLDPIVPPALVLAQPPTTRGGIDEDGTARWKLLWKQPNPSTYTVLQDLAEVAAKVIVEREKHYLADYPLTSTEPVTMQQCADALGKASGRNVILEDPDSFEASVHSLEVALFGKSAHPRVRDGAERLVLYYNRRGLRGNSGIMRWLLGREPTSHVDYYEAEVNALRS